jgi:hypothetical protein
MLAMAISTARKAVYKSESFMTQPVESVKWGKSMKTKLTIEVKVDLALVISALTGFVVAIAKLF